MNPNSEIYTPLVKFSGRIPDKEKAILRGTPSQPILFHGKSGRVVLLYKGTFIPLPAESYEKLKPYVSEICRLSGAFQVFHAELPPEIVPEEISLEVFTSVPEQFSISIDF